MKCRNCGKKLDTDLEEVLWCSLECKEKFLINNYEEHQVLFWFKKHDEKFNRKQKEILFQIKDRGLSVRDFMLSLEDFKDVDIEEKPYAKALEEST